MKKYLSIINTAWQRQLIYRATVYGYRLGHVVEVLLQITLWTAIFNNTSIVNGYSYKEMMTYVIIG